MLPTVKVLPRRVAVIAAVLMLVLAWVVGASQLTRASAASIDNAITGVNIVETSAAQSQAMRLNLTWAVPSTAKAGDTFTLKLPGALSSLTTGFDLKAPDGSLVATAKVVNGLVTFTLTNYVDTHVKVHGTAFFSVRWSKSESSVTGPVSLTFVAGSETFHDTVTKTGTTGRPHTSPHKNGFFTHIGTVTGTDALSWTLDSSSGPFTTAKFTDHLGPGQTYDCASVSYRLVKLDGTGAIASVTTLPSSRVIAHSCSTSSLTATLGPAASSEVLRLFYQTNVTDGSLTQYSNSAQITINGSTTSTVSRSVKVHAAGGNGQGSSGSPTSTHTSPTSTHTSPTSTHTSPTSTHTSPSVSPTSIHTSPVGKPTVLRDQADRRQLADRAGLHRQQRRVGPHRRRPAGRRRDPAAHRRADADPARSAGTDRGAEPRHGPAGASGRTVLRRWPRPPRVDRSTSPNSSAAATNATVTYVAWVSPTPYAACRTRG